MENVAVFFLQQEDRSALHFVYRYRCARFSGRIVSAAVWGLVVSDCKDLALFLLRDIIPDTFAGTVIDSAQAGPIFLLK